MIVKSAYLEGEIRDGERVDIASFQNGKLIQDCVILNSTAYLAKEKDSESTESVWNGNATEIGLGKYLASCGVDVEAATTERDGKNIEKTFTTPFNSERKRATSVIKIGDKYRVFVKGAPEIVIEYCVNMVGGKG